jgi:hypothetical protein
MPDYNDMPAQISLVESKSAKICQKAIKNNRKVK